MVSVWFFFIKAKDINTEKERLFTLCCESAWWILEIEPDVRKSRRIKSGWSDSSQNFIGTKKTLWIIVSWTCKFFRKHRILGFLPFFCGSGTLRYNFVLIETQADSDQLKRNFSVWFSYTKPKALLCLCCPSDVVR